MLPAKKIGHSAECINADDLIGRLCSQLPPKEPYEKDY